MYPHFWPHSSSDDRFNFERWIPWFENSKSKDRTVKNTPSCKLDDLCNQTGPKVLLEIICYFHPATDPYENDLNLYKKKTYILFSNDSFLYIISSLFLSFILSTDSSADVVTQTWLPKRFITTAVYTLFKLLACIYLVFSMFGKLFVKNNVDQQLENRLTPELVDLSSKENVVQGEEDDFLNPCRQRLLQLESLVTELLNKPITIPQEKDDMLVESLNRIKSIEYDLQKTKKALLATASKQMELAESLETLRENKLQRTNSCWVKTCTAPGR